MEVLVVCGVAAVLAAVAMPISNEFIKWAKADSSAESTLRSIEAGRDRAIAERRNIELSFVMPNKIRLIREEVNAAGATIGTTIVSEAQLDNGQQFLRLVATDTPDGFATANPTGAIVFGGTAPYMFTSDGTLIDSNGDPINGSVFVGVPSQPLTARAVTIFGVSGLTRIWKWRGSSWLK